MTGNISQKLFDDNQAVVHELLTLEFGCKEQRRVVARTMSQDRLATNIEALKKLRDEKTNRNQNGSKGGRDPVGATKTNTHMCLEQTQRAHFFVEQSVESAETSSSWIWQLWWLKLAYAWKYLYVNFRESSSTHCIASTKTVTIEPNHSTAEILKTTPFN